MAVCSINLYRVHYGGSVPVCVVFLSSHIMRYHTELAAHECCFIVFFLSDNFYVNIMRHECFNLGIQQASCNAFKNAGRLDKCSLWKSTNLIG